MAQDISNTKVISSLSLNLPPFIITDDRKSTIKQVIPLICKALLTGCLSVIRKFLKARINYAQQKMKVLNAYFHFKYKQGYNDKFLYKMNNKLLT